MKQIHKELIENSMKFVKFHSKIKTTNSLHWLTMCGNTLNTKPMKVWKYSGLDHKQDEKSNRDTEVESVSLGEYYNMDSMYCHAPRNFLDKLIIIRHMILINSPTNALRYVKQLEFEHVNYFFGSRITGLCKLSKHSLQNLCRDNGINTGGKTRFRLIEDLIKL
jgi:hypothetical protein